MGSILGGGSIKHAQIILKNSIKIMIGMTLIMNIVTRSTSDFICSLMTSDEKILYYLKIIYAYYCNIYFVPDFFMAILKNIMLASGD